MKETSSMSSRALIKSINRKIHRVDICMYYSNYNAKKRNLIIVGLRLRRRSWSGGSLGQNDDNDEQQQQKITQLWVQVSWNEKSINKDYINVSIKNN